MNETRAVRAKISYDPETSLNAELKRAHDKIVTKWLQLHYRMMTFSVLFITLIECLMMPLITQSDLMNSTISNYMLKFLIAPALCNLACLAAATYVMKAAGLRQRQRIYAISLLYVATAFIVYTVHSIFISVGFIFILPVIHTIFYTDVSLTVTTFITSVASFLYSELFLRWDPDAPLTLQSDYRFTSFILINLILIAVLFISLLFMKYEEEKNASSAQILKERLSLEVQLQFDSLTGIYNRTKLQTELSSLDSKPAGGRVILVMADIDRFKEINDRWGHPFGDECLIAFASILSRCCANATAFRFGGDEFCLLFYGMTLEQAGSVCEEIQASLASAVLSRSEDFSMTASFGLAESRSPHDVIGLFRNADQALYSAKLTRNSIVAFHAPYDAPSF
ncbi:hypothetical protein SDC9_69383 [bioreactor metagenome]|uniref:GGDEF domain-containing protein n=1 Tax=bioreactor metagenome TaxID=1076179 RepID=A0A644Y8M1_9ZZZZ